MAVDTADQAVEAGTAHGASISASVAGGWNTKSTLGSVISKDGITIGYRWLGHGPALVLMHGAMESSQSHIELAHALAPAFTVYLPDRRGRGMSGPYRKDYTLQEDVEDMDALLAETGAHFVFGVSSGAIICLQAALTLPAIHKVAIYEPPLSIYGSISTAFLSRYDQEIAEGKIVSALVTGMKGAQMGPPIFNAIPRPALEWLTTMMLNIEDKKAISGGITMRMLAPTLHYDFQLVVEISKKLESLGGLSTPVLLLGGGKSPDYLKVALNALEKSLPHARRIEFPSLGHGGSGNSNRGGKPERVAQSLRLFFADESA